MNYITIETALFPFLPPVPPECKVTQQGGEYVGEKNVTISGVPCVPWRKLKGIEFLLPAFPDPDRVDENYNLCRNPWAIFFNNSYPAFREANASPWCFIEAKGDVSWGFCDIPFCKANATADRVGTGVYPECRLDEKGKEYVGMQSETETGKFCREWNYYTDLIFWDTYPKTVFVDRMWIWVAFNTSLEDGWFCRNPGLYRERPWCFVSSDHMEWEYCDIPFCSDRSELNILMYEKCMERAN